MKLEIALYLIIPSIFFGAIVIWALLWSIKSNQFEDLDGAANRILFDDDKDDNKR